jgi:hypothetical protein
MEEVVAVVSVSVFLQKKNSWPAGLEVEPGDGGRPDAGGGLLSASEVAERH